MIRMLDHQMHVERKLRVFAHRGDDRRPERNIIDEMTIHYVEMQPIRTGFFGAMDLGFEMGKIRGENGRSDQNLGIEHAKFQGSVFGVQRPAKLAFLKPEPRKPESFRQLFLDDQGWRFMLPRFRRSLSRSQASTLDWNARLND